MDALMFFNEAKRMCKSYKDCENCPLDDNECCIMISLHGINQDVVQIVEQWSKDHPQKTRLQDFWEKYPNAPKDADGTPKTCCENLGYCKDCDEAGGDCKECWNMSVEE